MTTVHREQIRRIVDSPAEGPLRCSGCGWPSSMLGPHIVFLSFSQALFRGVVIDSGSQALQERLEDDFALCGECVASAAFLIDPAPARSARQRASEEQKRLRDEIANYTQTRKQVRAQIAESERRLADLREARDGVEALRTTAASWCSRHDLAARAFRDIRLRFWATERAQEGDESPEAAAEIAEAREQLDKARSALRALLTAGERLGRQCQDKGLSFEHRFILDRLATLGDLDG